MLFSNKPSPTYYRVCVADPRYDPPGAYSLWFKRPLQERNGLREKYREDCKAFSAWVKQHNVATVGRTRQEGDKFLSVIAPQLPGLSLMVQEYSNL